MRFRYLFCLLLLFALLSSCSVMKRHYRRGFFVEWGNLRGKTIEMRKVIEKNSPAATEQAGEKCSDALVCNVKDTVGAGLLLHRNYMRKNNLLSSPPEIRQILTHLTNKKQSVYPANGHRAGKNTATAFARDWETCLGVFFVAAIALYLLLCLVFPPFCFTSPLLEEKKAWLAFVFWLVWLIGLGLIVFYFMLDWQRILLILAWNLVFLFVGYLITGIDELIFW